MNKYKWFLIAPISLAIALVLASSAGPIRAQLNPTPMVITLTATPSPTSDAAFQPDRFEPNDSASLATPIGWQTEAALTLLGADLDYFTAYLKAGQIIHLSTTVFGGLDTRLMLFWNGQVVAENDDRSPTDLGSMVVWTAAADGWVVALVEKVTAADGRYDLDAALVAPTATATPPPTVTAQPTFTPMPTLTPAPTLTPIPSASFYPAQPAGSGGRSTSLMPDIQATGVAITTTDILTATRAMSLTVRHIGRVSPSVEPATTPVRLLVYYDANNDRSPGPGEGIPNASVLAVDAQGQRIARVFTNAQGEAFFNLSSDVVTRIIVPFVPGWSARVRVGELNDGIVLGLPAVRLPVFLPVADQPAGEE